MSEARLGRLVAAALHESLAMHLPFRVEFYEYWLQPPRLRAGTVGMASFLAVLSFLRQEGEIYSTIVRDAGRFAADWSLAATSPWTKARWRWLPRPLRLRAALRLARQLSAESSPATRGRIKWQRRAGRLQIEDSAFCSVRAPVPEPLCGFYAAALARFCESLGLEASVAHESCLAMGAPACAIAITCAPDERFEAVTHAQSPEP
jgi:hypothetical protein